MENKTAYAANQIVLFFNLSLVFEGNDLWNVFFINIFEFIHIHIITKYQRSVIYATHFINHFVHSGHNSLRMAKISILK